MRIAVIADTHDRLPASLRSALYPADEIWHLGDICSKETLRALVALGPPLHAIRGNRDPRGLAPASLTLQRGGRTFYLIHEPPRGIPEGATYALHGHTHVPRDETINGVRYLNPGSVGKANHGAPPSFAWLHIFEKRKPAWKIVLLD